MNPIVRMLLSDIFGASGSVNYILMTTTPTPPTTSVDDFIIRARRRGRR